jgi:hypothetical protein
MNGRENKMAAKIINAAITIMEKYHLFLPKDTIIATRREITAVIIKIFEPVEAPHKNENAPIKAAKILDINFEFRTKKAENRKQRLRKRDMSF